MKGILIFIVGIAFGAFGMLVAFPYLFPPPVLNESVEAMQGTSQLLGESRFREGVAGQDTVHWGRGGVKWYRSSNNKIFLELQKDFEVGAGPDYWLYLNTRADIDTEDDFLADADRIKLTKIKSFSGSQVYMVDANQFERARSITVWCETFSEYIASANLS